MKIYDIDGNILLDVPITSAATHEEELGKSDYVRLSWVSDAKQILAVGTYIIPFEDGLKYRLLEPYTPNQNNELEWKYEPEFQHPLMWLSKIPFTYTTVDKDLQLSYTSQDFPYLGLTTSLLQVVVDQINALFGFTKDSDKFTYQIIGNVDTTVNVTFSSTDILSALSAIANACTENDVEWHISWKQKCLYFGQIMFDMGEATPTLEVGKNIGKVSVTNTKDGYYNVFFPQGSTRNISTRLTNGHYLASSLRLGLNFPKYDDCKYPDGTIDIRTNKNEPKQILALTFDDVYPHVDCYVYNVRSRTATLKKEGTSEDALDNNGKPIKYSIWYFRLAYPLTVQKSGYIATSVLNGTTYYWYDYTINKEKDIVDGHKLMGQFTVNTHANALTQPLLGQPTATEGFEFVYHEADTDIELDNGSTVKKGDYEIVYSNNNDIIIPTTEEDGLYPRGEQTPSFTANKVILYNIVLTEQEIRASQDELLTKTQKEIVRRDTDLNNYSFPSYPDVFENEKTNPNLYIGKKVIFNDGAGNTLATRVIKLSTKIDFPFEQQITVGNQKIKGTQTQLREDVKTIMSGNWSGGGLNETQVKNLIQNFGASQFLSKTKDDSTNGLITFIKGLVSKAKAVFEDAVEIVKDLVVHGNIATEGALTTKEVHSPSYNDSADMGVGMGYHIWVNGTTSNMMIDNLTVRGKWTASVLEVMKLQYSAGNVTIDGAGGEIFAVEPYNKDGNSLVPTDNLITTAHTGNLLSDEGKVLKEDKKVVPYNDSDVFFYRCYFKATDGEKNILNMWHVGDQAKCQTFNLSDGTHLNAQNKMYFRVVINKSDKTVLVDGTPCFYIDLSNVQNGTLTGDDGKEHNYRGLLHSKAADGTVTWLTNDAPEKGDQVAHVGNIYDEDRQGAVQLIAVGETKGLVIYDGINETFLNLSSFAKMQLSPKNSFINTRFITFTNGYHENTPYIQCGDWVSGTTAHASEVWQHNGSSWICNKETTAEPSESNSAWSVMAKQGKQGIQGVPGNDGTSVTVKSTDITYAVSTQGTDASKVTGWQNTIPQTDDTNAFLWTRSIVTYSDGTTSNPSYSVSYKGKDGKGIVGNPATKYFNAGQNGAAQPTDDKFTSTSFPTDVKQGDYVWSLTTTTYTDGNSTKSYACNRIGADGSKGMNVHIAYATDNKGTAFSTTWFSGATWIGICESTDIDDPDKYTAFKWNKIKGDDGTSITITSTSVSYQLSNSGTTIPTGTWQSSVQQPTDDKPYLWTRTIVNYSDGTPATSYSVSSKGKDGTTPSVSISTNGYWVINGKETTDKAIGDDGHNPYVGTDGYWYTWDEKQGKFVSTGIKAKGDSVTIKSTEAAYHISNNGTTPPSDNNWIIYKSGVSIPQTTDSNPYLWTRVTVTYNQSSPVVSYSVSYKGKDGHTPSVTISSDGYWVIDGTKTNTKAQGNDGHTPTITISSDGYWIVDGNKTTTKAKGDQGDAATSYYINPEAILITERVNGITFNNDDTYTAKDYTYDIDHTIAIHKAVGNVDTIVKADSISVIEGGKLGLDKDKLQASYKDGTGYQLSSAITNSGLEGDTTINKIVVQFSVGTTKLLYPIYINRLGTVTTQTVGDATQTVRRKVEADVNPSIDAAQKAAKNASDAAQKAQDTANTASTAASNAQSAANTAQTTAQNAANKASAAQGAADKAQGSADSAQKAASANKATLDTYTAKTDDNAKELSIQRTKLERYEYDYRNLLVGSDLSDVSKIVGEIDNADVSDKVRFGGQRSLHIKGKADNYFGIYFVPIAIKHNTKYHISVWAKGIGNFNIELLYKKAASGRGKDRDGYVKYFNATTLTSADWTRYDFDFTTDEKHDWIECNFWTSDGKTECWMSNFMLEEGDACTGWTPNVNDTAAEYRLSSEIKQNAQQISLNVTEVDNVKKGLSNTGIDITNGKISSTADSFEWNDNDGNPIARFDNANGATFNGNVSAKTLSTNSGKSRIDEDGILHAEGADLNGTLTTNEGTTRAVLSGGGLQMFDNEVLQTEHTGKTFATSESILPSKDGTTISIPTNAQEVTTETVGAGESKTTTLTLATFTATANGVFKLDISDLHAQILGDVEDSSQHYGPRLYIELLLNDTRVWSDDIVLKTYSYSYVLREDPFSIKKYINAGQKYTLTLSVEINTITQSSQFSPKVHGICSVTLQSAKIASDSYLSMFFGNGLMFAKDYNHYIISMLENNIMKFEARNGNNGVCFDGDGIKMLASNGNWYKQPITVACLRISCDSNPSIIYSSESGFEITADSTGQYTLKFPSSYANLKLGTKGFLEIAPYTGDIWRQWIINYRNLTDTSVQLAHFQDEGKTTDGGYIDIEIKVRP